jgi:hypothetical protein
MPQQGDSTSSSRSPWQRATTRVVVVMKLLVTSANSRSDWDVGRACGNAVNLVLCIAGPHLLYIALPQGHINHGSVGRPRLGRREGFRSAVGLDQTGDQF